MSLEEAKLHLRVTSDDEDVLIRAQLGAALEHLQSDANLQLVTATRKLYLDQFPAADERIYLPRPPLQTVTLIEYLDDQGAYQTVAGTVYGADTSERPGYIYLKPSQSWPAVTTQPQAVAITYTAGYGDPEDVPFIAKSALLLKLGLLYEYRAEIEEPRSGGVFNPVPGAYQALVDILRIPEFR